MIHTEDVEPWELRRAMAGYAAQGYPPRYGKHPDGSGFVIVIVVPDGAAIPDWRAPQPQRRRWLRFDWRVAVKWLCVLVIVGGLGYLAYGVLTGAAPQDAQQAAQPSQAAALWDQIAAKLPQMPTAQPPAPNGEPAVDEAGFRWPWQDAQDAAGEAVESIKMAGLVIVLLVVVVCVLWVVGVARRAMGK
jgi:flagellar basal body-associated protein FliL